MWKILSGFYEIQRHVSTEKKEILARRSIISRLHYDLEVISSGSETTINKLEGMQSKVARYVLGRSRREWSRSGGYSELNWSTVPQMAVESSLKMFLKVLWTKKPYKLYKSIYCEENNHIFSISDEDLAKV